MGPFLCILGFLCPAEAVAILGHFLRVLRSFSLVVLRCLCPAVSRHFPTSLVNLGCFCLVFRVISLPFGVSCCDGFGVSLPSQFVPFLRVHPTRFRAFLWCFGAFLCILGCVPRLSQGTCLGLGGPIPAPRPRRDSGLWFPVYKWEVEAPGVAQSHGRRPGPVSWGHWEPLGGTGSTLEGTERH